MSTAYRIILEGAQEVPANGSPATGLGTFIFDSVAVAADYSINIQGLDFGPATGGAAQTPDPVDDVTRTHFHNAARGANGPIVFGEIDPPQDADDLAIILNPDGSWTVSGRWETTDQANVSIANFAPVLDSTAVGMDAPLYFNIHTAQFPGGAIRGQLVAISDDDDNVVEGTAGNDLLPGLGGNDVVLGLAGNDVLLGGTGKDLVQGGDGDDTIKATINDGHDVYQGDGGTDTVDYSALTEGVHVRLGSLFGIGVTVGPQSGVDLLASIENATGSQAGDKITGNRGDNVIEGAGGDDRMTGDRGDDTFKFLPDFGHDVITDLDDRGDDTIAFSTDVFADFDAVEDALSVAGRDVVITFDADNTITLRHTTLASITADDFQFI